MKKSWKTIFLKGCFGFFSGVLPALFLGAFLLMVFTSCAPEEPRRKMRPSHARQQFRPLTDYSLEIFLLTPKTVFPPEDNDAKLTFFLLNKGLKPVTIKEWRMNESSNIRIWYHPGKIQETKHIPLSSWKISATYDPEDKYVNMHNPLTINPADNKVLIQVPLAFIKHIKHAGQRQYFTIVAELNLTSVKVKSAPIEITVK